MSTTLKGAPIIGLPSGPLPSIKATLRYTRDYPGGVLGGLGAGSHEIEYVWPAAGPGVDMFAGSWRHVISLAPVQVAAAPFTGGGVQPEGVIFIGGSIKYATGNAQPFELRRLPVETSAGVLDLRIQIDPPAYTTPQSLAELLGSLEGLDTSLATGLAALDTGLADVTQAQSTLIAQVDAVLPRSTADGIVFPQRVIDPETRGFDGAQQGFVQVWTDAGGAVALGIRPDGGVYLHPDLAGLQTTLPVTRSGNDVNFAGVVNTPTETTFSGTTPDGFAYAITDANGAVAFGVRLDGSLYLNPTNLGFQTSLPVTVTGGDVAFTGEVSSASDTVFSGTTPDGYVYAWTDSTGRIALGIRTDGTVYANLSTPTVQTQAIGSDGTVYTVAADSGSKLQVWARRPGDLTARQITDQGSNSDVRVSGNLVNYTTDRNGMSETYVYDSKRGIEYPASYAADRQWGVDWHHLLGTGQSLSVGSRGNPPLSTTQPYSNLMFASNVQTGWDGTATQTTTAVGDARYSATAPLIESSSTGAGGVSETHSSAQANRLTKFALDAGEGGFISLVSQHGTGGQGYAQLKKGGSLPVYANSLTAVSAAKARATAAGKNYAVRAVTLVHGEADKLNASYGTQLVQWQADYEADIKAITGQSGSIPMIHSQWSAWTVEQPANKSTTAISPYQQLAATRSAPDKLLLACAKYHLTHAAADGVHLTNVGYRWLGEKYAQVIREALIEGRPWRPVMPRRITRSGAVITVDFSVPYPPLVLDSVNVTDPNGVFGFEYTDDASPPAIASVRVTGPTQVQVTLASVPTGTQASQRLRYAYTGVVDQQGGPTSGPRGCLRDNDPTVSLYPEHNYKLWNWCVHFNDPVTV